MTQFDSDPQGTRREDPMSEDTPQAERPHATEISQHIRNFFGKLFAGSLALIATPFTSSIVILDYLVRITGKLTKSIFSKVSLTRRIYNGIENVLPNPRKAVITRLQRSSIYKSIANWEKFQQAWKFLTTKRFNPLFSPVGAIAAAVAVTALFIAFDNPTTSYTPTSAPAAVASSQDEEEEPEEAPETSSATPNAAVPDNVKDSAEADIAGTAEQLFTAHATENEFHYAWECSPRASIAGMIPLQGITGTGTSPEAAVSAANAEVRRIKNEGRQGNYSNPAFQPLIQEVNTQCARFNLEPPCIENQIEAVGGQLPDESGTSAAPSGRPVIGGDSNIINFTPDNTPEPCVDFAASAGHEGPGRASIQEVLEAPEGNSQVAVSDTDFNWVKDELGSR